MVLAVRGRASIVPMVLNVVPGAPQGTVAVSSEPFAPMDQRRIAPPSRSR